MLSDLMLSALLSPPHTKGRVTKNIYCVISTLLVGFQSTDACVFILKIFIEKEVLY